MTTHLCAQVKVHNYGMHKPQRAKEKKTFNTKCLNLINEAAQTTKVSSVSNNEPLSPFQASCFCSVP